MSTRQIVAWVLVLLAPAVALAEDAFYVIPLAELKIVAGDRPTPDLAKGPGVVGIFPPTRSSL